MAAATPPGPATVAPPAHPTVAAAAPGAPTRVAPTAPPPTPRVGKFDDRGVVRRDSVHALSWRVRGTAKVQADADVGVARIDGILTIGGKLTADFVRAGGSLEIDGATDVKESLRVEGTLRAGAAVHAGECSLRGTARFGGEITVDRVLRMRGSLSAPSLRARIVDLVGAMDVPGDVTAERVVAKLPHDSRIGAIRARSVTMKGKVPNVVEKVLLHRTTVAVQRIEADAVTLEAMEVEFVRSPAIVLGRDCHVTTVEGTIVRQHASSDVGPRSKSPPPYGLRR